MGFKKDFVWGTATAAYQIEGAAFEDGKGLSVWDACCKRPGFVKLGDTGNVACDHYHKYKEDIKLMKEIGAKAYRMSISWPRVLPNGTGKINEKGLDFYDKLIDELLKNGITPYITLFHWDYPQELYKRGGWLNPDSSDWFAEYTKVIVDRLSDRVNHWMTENEPQCYINLGHDQGTHAPGLKLDLSDVLLAGHNSLLAHGKAVQTIRNYSKLDCEIGYAPIGVVSFPDTNSKEDIEAARQATFGFDGPNLWNSSWWIDPAYLGHYPEEGLKVFEKWMPKIGADDMKIIHQPVDFLGINVYQGTRVRMNESGKPEAVELKMGHPETAIKWPVTPDALYWAPKFFYDRYKKPIIITENGMSNSDWVSLDGKVHDSQRIDFLNRYLKEYKRAAEDGVDAKGYFCWSLMDNFEWAEGYNERFGLIYVDYETQKRTIKDSGYWYKQVVDSNGENL